VQRQAGERVPESLGDRGADVRERLERRRHRKEHRIVRKGDEGEARAGVERNALHRLRARGLM